MYPEGSVPLSQESPTYTYPKPMNSVQTVPNLFLLEPF